MRKALVNDIVHSFCYALRTKKEDSVGEWPHIIFGWTPMEPREVAPFDSTLLIPFISYALSRNPYTYGALLCIIKISDYLRTFDSEEQQYAIQLMERYYQ